MKTRCLRNAMVLLLALLVLLLGSCTVKGATGAQGEQGPAGETGADGKNGITPHIGDNGNWWIGTHDTGVSAVSTPVESVGKSAYELYCEKYGYTGTEAEWLERFYSFMNTPTSEEIYRIADAATVLVACYDINGDAIGTGSGFFINATGLIATAHHVIDGAYSISVRMSDSGTYPVLNVVGFDEARDIALLQISKERIYPYLTLETEGIVPGETAYTFGSPLGLESSFSAGVVASDLRELEIDSETEETYSCVQYTASSSPGNSGGPLLNAQGRVIGIVCSGLIDGNDLNFATYVGELAEIDRTYSRSVSLYYKDTEYFQIKCFQKPVQEVEPNNAAASANLLTNGNTVIGVTALDAHDDFRVTLTEESDFNIAYVVHGIQVGGIYYPYLCDASYQEISLEWTEMSYGDYTVYYAYVDLPAGTYYVEVEGRNAAYTTEYGLYTYWRPIDELLEFPYEIYDTDFLM